MQLMDEETVRKKQRTCRIMRTVGIFCSWCCVGMIGFGLLLPDPVSLAFGAIFLPFNLIGVWAQGKMIDVLDNYITDNKETARKSKIDELYGRN